MRPNFTIQVVPLITRPRHDRGVDWGKDRKIVARNGNTEIVWLPGHTCRIGIGLNEYFPAELQFVADTTKIMEFKSLHEGGKLSRKLLEQCGVDKLMAAGLSDSPDVVGHWKPNHTVVINIAAEYIKGKRQ
jgi:hypothetical protein